MSPCISLIIQLLTCIQLCRFMVGTEYRGIDLDVGEGTEDVVDFSTAVGLRLRVS